MAVPPFPLTLTSPTYDTTAPKFGTAAMSGGKGTTAAAMIIPGTTVLTLECWTNSTDETQETQVLCGQENTAYLAKFGDHYFAVFGSDANGTSIAIDYQVTTTDGAWHHIAMTCDAGGAAFYVDGVQRNSSSASFLSTGPDFLQNFGVMDLGAGASVSEPYIGQVDEVRVSNVKRYNGNFTLATAPFTGNENNTTALYHLDSNGTDSSTTGGQPTPVTPTTIVAVNSTAIVFSPGNWRGDTVRGGSVSRTAWNNGASFRIRWTASDSPLATLNFAPSSASNTISYFINGILVDGIAANNVVELNNIAVSATNDLVVYLRNSAQTSRWAANATNVVEFTGFQIDTSSAAGVAPVARPWALIIGDSITEGIEANGGGDDFLSDYSFLTTEMLDQLGYDTCVSACGFSGFINPGDSEGDVPAYYDTPGGVYNDTLSRWNKISAGVSLLDSAGQISAYGATGTPPALIYINYGTNEALDGLVVADFQAAITQCMAALRAAAPTAKICIQIPFGLQNLAKYPDTDYVAAIRAGFAAYTAAHPGDSAVFLFDFGLNVANIIQNSSYINGDNVHPLAPGHALVAPMVGAKMVAALTPSGGGGIPNRWTHA